MLQYGTFIIAIILFIQLFNKELALQEYSFMPNFYANLTQIERLLDDHLNITTLEDGIIRINGHIIDTNQQLEMLSPQFFAGTAGKNPTINAYNLLFQNIGILPAQTPEIPLIRDIPLRTQTLANQNKQQILFAQFMGEHVLANQWTMLFPDEYQALCQAIALCFNLHPRPLARKRIIVDAEGQPLSSGGYDVELHLINGLQLWLRLPESLSETNISAAIEKTLNDTENSNLVINSLKPGLLQKRRIAFNVRGVTKSLNSKDEIQNIGLGGGHQHFLLLDRATQTIYAINDTRGATAEDPQAFKQQIELFLQSLGDHTPYNFKFIQGKSRQPDNASYLNQVCSISQFCHYAALLSGVKINEIQDNVPPKISTLMYLLQYAYINQDNELFNILDHVITQINMQITVQTQVPEQDIAQLPTAEELDPQINIHVTEPIIRTDLNPVAKISAVKNHLNNHPHLLQVIIRLEQGSKSYNPYWMNSSQKLNRIIDCLIECVNNNDNPDELLANPESNLSKAVNMRRLPVFNFFEACHGQGTFRTKSRDMIDTGTDLNIR